MSDEKIEVKCGRDAKIWVNASKVDVICILSTLSHPDDWHRDSIYGDWDEVEELDERYTEAE
jgi:hypothetical protein